MVENLHGESSAVLPGDGRAAIGTHSRAVLEGPPATSPAQSQERKKNTDGLSRFPPDSGSWAQTETVKGLNHGGIFVKIIQFYDWGETLWILSMQSLEDNFRLRDFCYKNKIRGPSIWMNFQK